MQTRTPALAPPTQPRRRRRGSSTAPDVAAVLALQRSAGNRATRALMRQPATTVPAPPPTRGEGAVPAPPTVGPVSTAGDVATVTMSDGTRYVVTRKRSTVPIVNKRGQVNAGFGGDLSRVWLKVSWCRGTRGEIRVGGDPQAEAKDLLKNLAQGIANGGDADDVKRIISAAEIKPFVDWDIQRPGDWKITGEVVLTFDKSGFKKAEGKVGVDKGPFEGSVGGSGDREGGWSVTVQGKWTPGRKPQTKGQCPPDELFFPYEYECVHERDIKPTVKKVPRTVEDKFPEHRFIYFNYMSDVVNGRLTTKADMENIRDLMRADYKVTKIQAFTSPEGLRSPSAKWPEGNVSLSDRRAAAAKKLAEQLCPDGGCITGGIEKPNDPELLALDFENLDGTTSEGAGKALEDEVIRMWNEASSDDIKEQKTPAADKRVAAARGRHAKAEIIYEYLRRARLDLERVERHEVIDEVSVPGRVERTSGNCPKDVLDAALLGWRTTGL